MKTLLIFTPTLICLIILGSYFTIAQRISRETKWVFKDTVRVMIIYYNKLDTTHTVKWTFGYQVGDKILDLRKEPFKHEPIMIYEK